MNSGNLYSVNDKAIYDALNQGKVTKTDLKELFLARGVVISSDTSRKELASYFSRLIHDYYDYQVLARILGTHTRRDKATVSYVPLGDLSIDDIENAAHELDEKISDLDAASEVNRVGGRVEVVVNYRTTNFNKNEFRQVVDREAVINLEVEDGKLAIRSPLTDTVEDVKKMLVDIAGERADIELPIENINMQGIQDPKKRTEFFERLVNGVEGLQHYDVTDVYIYHPKNNEIDEDGEEDEDTVDLGVHITKASLKGEKVLQSDELKGLYDKGFYIWKIVWQAVENSYDSDIYEFEAQFSDPEVFSKFSYLARGFYKYKEGGEHNSSKTQFSTFVERKFELKLENAALDAIKSISESSGPGGSDG